VARYRSKPVEVDAVQWTGDNADEVRAFVREHDPASDQLRGTGGFDTWAGRTNAAVWVRASNAWCDVHVGSYVMAERNGPGVYPCRRADFEDRWDPIPTEPCTGLAAAYCPNHGDCTCPHDRPDGERTLEDVDCPLHAPSSTHASVDDEQEWATTGSLLIIEGLVGIIDQLTDALSSEHPTPERLQLLDEAGRALATTRSALTAVVEASR